MGVNLQFVGIGEALIDLFDSGSASLGGAPLNVAVHAHHLLHPLGLGRGVVISAVGRDERGDYARSVLAESAMPLEYVATNDHPTGTADVFVRNGESGFEIAQNVAWDYIETTADTDALANCCDAICFGSLAQRSEVSRKTIRAFVERAKRAWRLYDVNFRRSTLSGTRGYSREIVEASCALSRAIKANEHEIFELAAMFGLPHANDLDTSAIRPIMEFFVKEFALEAVIVTRAERGALVVTSDDHIELPPATPSRGPIHPVGAGDAFSAGILFGRSQSWPWRPTLDLASQMGAWVTQRISAIPPLAPDILSFAREQMRLYSKVV
jgi:fructokinase